MRRKAKDMPPKAKGKALAAASAAAKPQNGGAGRGQGRKRKAENEPGADDSAAPAQKQQSLTDLAAAPHLGVAPPAAADSDSDDSDV